ncbi:MAG TPA: Hsp20/alpha crystallin family protein [Gammaproteobacteria bacterium]|nr:Hsp20/alpha crystallin family protein [Gammaproteobacteria bacterium]
MKNIIQQPGREIGWGLFNNSLDDVFEGFYRPYSANPGDVTGGSLVPAIDLHENDNSYTVRAEIPGVKKEDIDVTVNDGVLTINAETRYENEEKEDDGRVLRQERRYGKYVRSIRLGKDVDESHVKAKYKDGVLELELPKVEEVKPKKISIDVN